jgi:hypothetical protein
MPSPWAPCLLPRFTRCTGYFPCRSPLKLCESAGGARLTSGFITMLMLRCHNTLETQSIQAHDQAHAPLELSHSSFPCPASHSCRQGFVRNRLHSCPTALCHAVCMQTRHARSAMLSTDTGTMLHGAFHALMRFHASCAGFYTAHKAGIESAIGPQRPRQPLSEVADDIEGPTQQTQTKTQIQ